MNPGRMPQRTDGLGLDPPVPLPDDQALGFFLFHSMRAELKEPSNLQGMATLEEMITKPFFPMGKDGCNSRDCGNRQTTKQKDRPKAVFSVALIASESGYVQRAIPPPIYTQSPKV